MPDNEAIINGLKSEIQQFEEAKRIIDERIEAFLKVLRYYEMRDNDQQPRPLPTSHEDSPVSAHRPVKSVIYDILSAERSLHRTTIYERLVQEGIDVSETSVAAYLSNDERFKNLGNELWGLSNLSNYEPDAGIQTDSDDETLDVPW